MEKHDEYIEIIRMSVDRLNFLSENMIKISRLEGGLIHLNIRNQSLNETVMKSVKVFMQGQRKIAMKLFTWKKKILYFPMTVTGQRRLFLIFWIMRLNIRAWIGD